MALDIVKQIIEIEREGDEIVKKSQEQALQIQREAEEESQRIIENALKKSKEHYNSIVEGFEKEAEVLSKPILEESIKAINALNNISEDLLDEAVNLVIERIVNSHGNS